MRVAGFIILLVALTGCAAQRAANSTVVDRDGRETTDVMARGEAAERTGRVDFWMSQPPSVVVEGGDFSALFSACEEAARDFLFRIDRSDHRTGRIITMPMTSAQFFEFLRRDVQTIRDLVLSSTATYRRTLVIEIARTGDNRFEATPKVVIERLSRLERRITSVVLYRGVFGRRTASREVARGTRESDAGVRLPEEYWYAVSRDDALERAIAKRVRDRLSGSTVSIRSASAR